MPDCNIWDPTSPLGADPLVPKGLSADTSAAYGLLAFLSENPRMKLVLTGTFPKGKYMSLQIYRGRLQSSDGVGEVLSDQKIAANLVGKNPYQTHNPSDTGKFRIEVTPDPSAQGVEKENTIWYDPNPGLFKSRLISAFYRVYQPDGGAITTADLPKIEARDYLTDAVLPCPIYQQLDWYLDLPNDIIDILNDFILLETKPLKLEIKEETAGSNRDAIYALTYKNIPIGSVTIIKFRAPSISFASPDVGSKAVRYWSLCPIYWPMLKTLNGVACDWANPGERDVLVVFGPDDPQVKSKAHALNAKFLPDRRTANEQVMGFIARNLLPSDSFKDFAFKGAYLPHGDVFSRDEFLNPLEA